MKPENPASRPLCLMLTIGESTYCGAHTLSFRGELRPYVTAEPGYLADSYEYRDSEEPLRNLIVTALLSEDIREAYGRDIEFRHEFSIDLPRARQMVAILDRTHKALDRIYTREGACYSLGQWVNRVARALGVETVFVPWYHERRTLDGFAAKNRRCDLSDIVSAVDHYVNSWLAEHPAKIAA